MLAAFIGCGGYGVHDAYRAGLFTRPSMPEGAFSVSYKSGLRGILVDVPNEKTTRRYLGFPQKVPFYLEDAWSFCRPPNEDEQEHVSAFMKDRNWPGERFEAVCKIEVDDKVVVRGLITSVPKL
ncbi:hypothetical protein [Mesorhizobium argentiipisi]|uniref:Uncharacterized protein n=1 Tax=Mesorhizobium argentiipisi TaxID=3015175 RepID=A0ABU8KHN3_9HYPH